MTDAAVHIQPLAADAQPDVPCPLCRYNLRGLVEPRCPECGYSAASWDEMRRRSSETHPFLFEHHPERNLSSRMQTWLAGLNPWRFWKSVRPEHRTSFRRLVRYWIVFVPLMLLPIIGILFVVMIAMHMQFQRDRAAFETSLNAPGSEARRAQIIKGFGSIDAALDAMYPQPGSWQFFRQARNEAPAFQLLLPFLIFVCAWPWLVVPAMQCFAITLRRARIRPVQLFRCAVYSWDLVALSAVLLLLGAGLMLLDFTSAAAARAPGWALPPWYYWQLTVARWFMPVTLLVALVVTLRLAVSFARYLRLRHAYMTAVLVQIVLGLVCAKFMFVSWGH